MSLVPLDIPPGVFRNGTAYQSTGRWFSAAFMRWFAKTIRPFGGWAKRGTTMAGVGRGILTWRPSDFAPQAIIGTPSNLYIWDGDQITNITPVGMTEGTSDTIPGTGFGFGLFGAGPFGAPNPFPPAGTLGTEATIWSLDTWGDDALVVASHDQVIRQYAGGSLPPVAVVNAPPARGLFVTSQRCAVAVAADGDQRYIRWSDFENNTIWTAASNNAAGDWRFQTDGVLVVGKRVKGTHLLWTTTDLWRMDFIGGALVYRIEKVSADCGLVGPLAVVEVDGGAMWMGTSNFFAYSGGRVAAMKCEVYDYVFGDINLVQRVKFNAGRISRFGEILFFYASANSTAINRCVSYNQAEDHWNIVDPDGDMARGCWADAGAFSVPLAVGVDGNLYEQETGWTADGTTLVGTRGATSGPIQLGTGDSLLEATQMLTDEGTQGSMTISFTQQFTPNGPVTTRGPYPVTKPYTDVRLTARQVGVQLQATADEDFRFGRQRLEVKPGGGR